MRSRVSSPRYQTYLIMLSLSHLRLGYCTAAAAAAAAWSTGPTPPAETQAHRNR